MKLRFDSLLFLFLLYSSGVMAQSAPEFILPAHVQGSIQLNLSTFANPSEETATDDYLAVFVKNEREDYVSNAIQGRYTTTGNYLLFKPYFPFESGMDYVLRIKNTNAGSFFYQSFRLGKKKTPSTAKVISIYPSAQQLPENLLRFYVYFNTPMKKGQALKYLQLKDEAGMIDSRAFMEFKQELWSEDGKRLTVLFDPGRIKRGVSTNSLLGPALLEGKRYNLSVSPDWQDVYGQALSKEITKAIKVVSAYRHPIQAKEWEIDQPRANSSDTLMIHFDRIMDHALLQSMIQLKDASEQLVAGHWEIIEQEQLLQFIPNKKWHNGTYKIIIDSRLEDVAGNSLQNLLDHKQLNQTHTTSPYQFIAFTIGE